MYPIVMVRAALVVLHCISARLVHVYAVFAVGVAGVFGNVIAIAIGIYEYAGGDLDIPGHSAPGVPVTGIIGNGVVVGVLDIYPVLIVLADVVRYGVVVAVVIQTYAVPVPAAYRLGHVVGMGLGSEMNAAKAVVNELAVYDCIPRGRYLYTVFRVAYPDSFYTVVAAQQFQTFSDIGSVDHRGGRI